MNLDTLPITEIPQDVKIVAVIWAGVPSQEQTINKWLDTYGEGDAIQFVMWDVLAKMMRATGHAPTEGHPATEENKAVADFILTVAQGTNPEIKTLNDLKKGFYGWFENVSLPFDKTNDPNMKKAEKVIATIKANLAEKGLK